MRRGGGGRERLQPAAISTLIACAIIVCSPGSISSSATVLRGPPNCPESQCVVAWKQGKPRRLSPSPINSVLEILIFHLLTLCKHFVVSLVLCRGGVSLNETPVLIHGVRLGTAGRAVFVVYYLHWRSTPKIR